MPSKAGGGRSGAPPAPKAKAVAGSRVPPVLREDAARPASSSSAAAHRRPPPSAATPPKAPSRGHAKQPPTAATAATTSRRPSAGRPAVAAPSPPAEFSAVAASHALLAEQSAALDLEQLRREPPPQGVVVAVRVRPIGPVAEGSVREDPSPPVVTMEGQVTRVHSADERAQVHEFRVDHSYWSCDGCVVGADGSRRPDGEASRYSSQDAIWRDLAPVVLGNTFNGVDATVIAYGQAGSGKTYTMSGGQRELGLVPRALHALFALKAREEA